jgi:hypothetical protein
VEFMTTQETPSASGGITITTGSTDFLAPDGTSGSITKYVGGAASGVQSAYYGGAGVAVSASGQHRFSLFVKAGASNPLNFCAIQFGAFTGASGTATSYFNLASGTALTSGSSIENYGNGWYRCISAPYTIASGDLVGTVFFALAEGNNDITWSASGALNLTAYTWGAQMEAGSVATSYIPTTTGSVTRNADVVTLSGAVSGCIGQTEGTIYAEVDIRNITKSFTVPITISDGTVNPNNGARIQFSSSEAWQAIIRANNSQIFAIAGATSQPQGIYKVALGYKSGGSFLYVNGTQVATSADSFTFSAALTQVNLYGASAGSNVFNNPIRAVAVYTTCLTNDELVALTTL